MSPKPKENRDDIADWPDEPYHVYGDPPEEVNGNTVQEGHKVDESAFLVESGEDLAPSGEDEIQKHGELGLRGGCDWDH